MIEFEQTKPLRDSLNLTSLIDVIFLLLLFFLLASVFADPGIPLDLPEAATAEFQQEQTEQVIYISKSGEIYVNGQFVLFDSLPGVLSEMLQSSANKQVTIKADKEVAFGIFIRILDVAKQAGGQDVVISAELPSK
jgi:biopolymer transport protein ExbD